MFPAPRPRSTVAWVYSTVLVFLTLLGCSAEPPEAGPPPPPEVLVVKPVVKKIIEWDQYTGRLTAVDSVEIRARVSGYLESIHFTDGQMVKEGDLLFVIDPRPFQAAVDESKALVTQSQSRLDLAKNDLDRAERLMKDRAISAEELDSRSKEVQRAQAELDAARARVQSTELDLEFTRVCAPFSGRVGRHLESIGTLVSGGANGSTILTTIVSLDPIHVYFEGSERDFLKYSRLDREGKRPSSRDNPNPVQVRLANEDEFVHDGRMDFVDNQIDTGTGTIQGRAILGNADGILTPGLFVDVRLPGSGEYEATLIPDQAVATDQSQKIVYVVDSEGNARYRKVVLGPLSDGLRIVRSGLSGADEIVLEGIQRVRDGEPVDAKRTTVEAWIRERTGDVASSNGSGD